MSTGVDRRKFLKYTGAAGAATGAAWVAPSVLGSSSAFAAGSCDKKDQINWAGYAGNTLDTTGTATFYLDPDRVVGTGAPDYQVTMTVTPVGVVASREASTNVGNAYGNLAAVYELTMTGNTAGASSAYGWDVTFSWPVSRQAYALSYALAVVDENTATPGFKDHAYLDSTRYGPTYSSTWIEGQGTSLNPWTGKNGEADKTRNRANVTLNDDLNTGVSSMTVSYRGDDTFYGLAQSIGIGNITWCL